MDAADPKAFDDRPPTMLSIFGGFSSSSSTRSADFFSRVFSAANWLNRCCSRAFSADKRWLSEFKCCTVSSRDIVRTFFRSRAVCAATRFFSFLRLSFSSGDR